METKIINRCPKCQSEKIDYVIDIFCKKTDKRYYTGKCVCDDCKYRFDAKDIIKKEWITIDDTKEWLLNEIHRSGAPTQMLKEFEKCVQSSTRNIKGDKK